MAATIGSHVRHIHIPDIAPRYVPDNVLRALHSRLREDAREVEKLRGARTAPDKPWLEPTPSVDSRKGKMRRWLPFASPMPTLISLTHQPYFLLPAHPEQLGLDTKLLKAPLKVVFPEPPGWSPDAYTSSLTENLTGTGTPDPLNYVWACTKLRQFPPGKRNRLALDGVFLKDLIYQGPGVLSIWATVGQDMSSHSDDQRRGELHKLRRTERILATTTISVLRNEYGLNAFEKTGSRGIWVSSQQKGYGPGDDKTRLVATILQDSTFDAYRLGVNIHVGQPIPTKFSRGESAEPNPWARIGQGATVTSIVAELSNKPQKHAQRDGPRSRFLQYEWPEKSEHDGLPYSVVHWKRIAQAPAIPTIQAMDDFDFRKPGERGPDKSSPLSAPLGMDNYDLATAWAFEFAAQWGAQDEGFRDQLAEGYLDQLDAACGGFVPSLVSSRHAHEALPLPPTVTPLVDEKDKKPSLERNWVRGWYVTESRLERFLREAGRAGRASNNAKSVKDTRMITWERERAAYINAHEGSTISEKEQIAAAMKRKKKQAEEERVEEAIASKVYR